LGSLKPEAVLVHDFAQDAVGQAVPYGIYNLNDNHGYVGIGDCFDTPRFAVETITDWWQCEGHQRYPKAKRLLILADAGGSNSCRSRVWKARLQEMLCDAWGLTVTAVRLAKRQSTTSAGFAPVPGRWAS